MSRQLIFRTSAGFMFIAFSIALPSMSMDFSQEPSRLGGGQVLSIAFSPDEKILASGRDDRTIHLWDVDGQKQIGILRGHTDWVVSAAFSPDGKTLASGGQRDRTVRLWDVAGRYQVGVMQAPAGVASVAFSPDGTILASAGGWNDNAVYLWDVQTQKQIGVLLELNRPTRVAFSPDGRILASNGTGAAAVRLWDVAGQKQVGDLEGHTGEILFLAFSPDRTILASASGLGDKAVYLWNFRAQEQVGVLGGHSAHVGSVAFSPNGKLLASTVYWDDTVHFWDVEGQEQVGVLKGHNASDMGWGDQVAFSSNGTWLACGSENGVELWELNLPGPISRAYAYGPQPFDGTLHADTWVNLDWRPGDFAVSHDVYMGENFDDVNASAESTFVGNQAGTDLIVGFPGYAYPDGLVPGTTYYWRIDEVNDTEPNSPWKGEIWSFTVPPKTAYSPDPADGVKFLDPDVTLNWTAGYGANLHTVYFGDNLDDVNNATGGALQTAITYTPGTLANDTVYFWRVDESSGGRGSETHKGDVWSFRTRPVIPITDPNLVGWWKLDEGMGTNALDWSGHGNHGKLFGPEWTMPGLLGDAALNFSGGGYVAIQNLSYNSTDNTELTVCAWIRTSSAATQYIASFDRNEYWRLEINGDGGGLGQVGWDVMTSSGQVDYGSSTRVDDGLWHHVTGVFDNGRLTIYIDGFAEPSATGGSTFGSGTTRFGFIGANSEASSFNGSNGGVSPVFGDIDELRIYDKVLTVEEILLAKKNYGQTPINGWGECTENGDCP